MKEADLKLAVSQYLEYGTNQGRWYADRLNSGSALVKRGEKVYRVELCREGTADFMVLMGDGVFEVHLLVIFLELKGDRGKQSEAQREFQKLVEAQGCEYYIVRSIEELEEILE